MPTPKNIKHQITELAALGKSYREIASIIGCSKGTISYHLGDGQKLKTRNRQQQNRKLQHPFLAKIQHFKGATRLNQKYYKYQRTVRKMITDKTSDYCNRNQTMSENFTIQDIINKFGETPKCYLTGKPINIYEPQTYHFDHKIPASRGGTNTLDNLGICTKEANMAKSDLTVEEFLYLCKQVLDHHKAEEKGIEPLPPQ